jgi:mevalonate pyrophosphate decarboxylase
MSTAAGLALCVIENALLDKEIAVVEINRAIVQVSGSSANSVIGEIPVGAINGSNATFTSAFVFVPESLKVFLNGVRQKLVSDYTSSGGSAITFLVSPIVGDSILIDYQRI